MNHSESAITRCVRLLKNPHRIDATDSDLIRRYVESGDETAFELLVWRHFGMVLRTCRAVLRDHHSAEDAAQAAFLAFAKKASSIRDRESSLAWLHTTAYRFAMRLAVKNRHSRTEPVEAILHKEPLTNDDHDMNDDSLACLHEELVRLSNKHRLPLILCYFEGLTHQDVARRLGWPVGSVKSRIAKAKEILQSRLTKRGITATTLGLMLTVNTAVSPGLVAATCRAAASFMAGTGEISPVIASLARSVARDAVVKKICVASAVFAVTVTSVLFASVSSGEPVKDRLPAPMFAPTSAETFTVLAPAPHKGKRTIDPETIAEWEKHGFVYGGFKTTERAYRNGVKVWFQAGRAAAESGVPGFSWHPQNSDRKNKQKEVPTFPEIDVPFGLHINSVEAGAELAEALVTRPKLTILTFAECRLSDEDLQKLESLNNLTYLAIEQNHFSVNGSFLRSKFKNLETVCLDPTALTDPVIANAAKANRLHLLSVAGGKLMKLWKCNRTGRLTETIPPEEKETDGVWVQSRIRPTKADEIEVLALEGTGITNEAVACIEKLNNLKILEIYGTEIDPERLAGMKSLESLRFNTHNVSENSFLALFNSGMIYRSPLIVLQEGAKNPGPNDVDTLTLSQCHMTDGIVSVIQQFKNLKHLNLEGSDVSDEQLESLAKVLTKLQVVNLSGCQSLTPAAIAKLRPLKELQYLNFDRQDITAEHLQALEAFPQLAEVHLHGLNESHIAKLLSIGKLHCWKFVLGPNTYASDDTIEYVQLHHTQMDKNVIQSLAKLQNLKTMLITGDLTPTVAAQLGELKHLKNLKVHGTTRIVGKDFRTMKNWKTIETLQLRGLLPKIDGEWAEVLNSMPNIRSVEIEMFEPKGADLVKLLKGSCIRFKTLASMTDEVILTLAKEGLLHRMSFASGPKQGIANSDDEIQKLVLEGRDVTDASITRLKLKNLEVIDLSRTEAGLESFIKLAALDSVKCIQAYRRRVDTHGIDAIIQAKVLHKFGFTSASHMAPQVPSSTDDIVTIDLGGVFLSELTTDELVKALPVKLKSLALSGTCISTNTAESLSKFTLLESLDLNDSSVSDEVLDALAKLPSPLKQLSIVGARVSPATLEHFRKRHPDCLLVLERPQQGD